MFGLEKEEIPGNILRLSGKEDGKYLTDLPVPGTYKSTDPETGGRSRVSEYCCWCECEFGCESSVFW